MLKHYFVAIFHTVKQNPKREAFYTKDAMTDAHSIMMNIGFADHSILFWVRLKAALAHKLVSMRSPLTVSPFISTGMSNCFSTGISTALFVLNETI